MAKPTELFILGPPEPVPPRVTPWKSHPPKAVPPTVTLSRSHYRAWTCTVGFISVTSFFLLVLFIRLSLRVKIMGITPGNGSGSVISSPEGITPRNGSGSVISSLEGITPGPGNGSGSAVSSPADRSSPCPDPWILITDKCYFFSEKKKRWRDSKKDCEERDSRLATVKEGRILRLVTTTEQEFWIGLYSLGSHHDGGTWSGRWSDGSVVNVTEGSGTCAKIHRVLRLHNCNGGLHWICERDVRDP